MKHYFNQHRNQYKADVPKFGSDTQSYSGRVKDYTEPTKVGGLNKARKMKMVTDSVSNTLSEFNAVLANHRWREKQEHRADQQREARRNKRATTL